MLGIWGDMVQHLPALASIEHLDPWDAPETLPPHLCGATKTADGDHRPVATGKCAGACWAHVSADRAQALLEP